MNSDRLYKDKEGNMFVPMNVEGNSYHENFFSTPKIVVIVGEIISFAYIVFGMASAGVRLRGIIVYLILWFLQAQWLIRYVVFEEKYYYRMYKELKGSEVSTPATFWNIASLQDTEEGCMITYMDGKLAMMIRLERDTITGKPPSFKEEHYDGISDFYRELNKRNYSYVHANIMEMAGKDERINELDKLVYKDDNKNIQKLMEYQIGYIKNVTRRALYENDYVLIFTKDLNKIDRMSSDIADAVYHILDGAYISYSVLDSDDVTDMVKERNGVQYFNPTEATLIMFEREGAQLEKPFRVDSITYTNGMTQELNKEEERKLERILFKLSKGEELKETIEEALNASSSRKKSFADIYENNKVGEEFIGEDEDPVEALLSQLNREDETLEEVTEEITEDDFIEEESNEETEKEPIDLEKFLEENEDDSDDEILDF